MCIRDSPSTVEEAFKHLSAVDDQLGSVEPENSSYDFYWMSILAFAHQVVSKHRKKTAAGHEIERGWIWKVIKDAKVQEKLLKAEAGKGENDIEMGELEVESKKDELDFICELIGKLNDLDSKILERLRERQRLKLDGLYQEVDGCASADTLRDLLAKVSQNWSFEGGLDGTSARGLQLCLLYTSPSPRDRTRSRMPSSA